MNSGLKKILFILHLPPPIHGPAVIGEYIRQSAVINSGFDCNYINLSISSSLGEIGAKSSSKLFRYLNLIWKVTKQLIFNRPDLCYITLNSKGSGFYKDSIIALIVQFFRVKRIYHFHNKGITDHRITFFENLLYKQVFRNADVILISERLYYDFKKYVPLDKVHYCTNGIPDNNERQQVSGDRRQATTLVKATDLKSDHSQPATRNPQPTSAAFGNLSSATVGEARNPQPATILFLSNLIESKGLFVLLAACEILIIKGIPFRCVISGAEGDISNEQLALKLKDSGLEEVVFNKGLKLGHEKQEVFSDAEIFILPTFYPKECLPLVIIEAMQNSLPVISTNEGAITDAVEDGVNGYIVPKKDPVSLAQKMELLISDADLRKKMGSAGRMKYENEFMLGKFEIRLSEILAKISYE